MARQLKAILADVSRLAESNEWPDITAYQLAIELQQFPAAVNVVNYLVSTLPGQRIGAKPPNWIHLALPSEQQDLSELAAKAALDDEMRGRGQSKNPAPSPPLLVNRGNLTATITKTGKVHELGSEAQAAWLAVLNDRPGQWVSSADLEGIDSFLMDRRTDRLLKQLPPPLQKLIETKRNKGARLKVQ